ncbi:uncharacterized protein SAMN05421736_10150 [Evansella caseinilytica]|uniref:DUF418 domain-containing protein n=1 Tax=Evansella caseinilytica TaxID=1503961 RepID=A0A1H3G2M9_9BACI|nr:DUF418 domain-containing protein [Evansella caseinilytica]SDX97476.1 uncharacterized protein SAMN05421736_10150 [Evansella caseinilytica]
METKNNEETKKKQANLSGKLTPLDADDRLHHIDSLRGFALLGILLVNMLAFQYGTIGYKFIYPTLLPIDKSAFSLIEWLFQGSFYPIFSMLFGFGAVIMWERAEAKARPFNRIFIRRLLILLVIGFMHLHFLWDGDILFTYAITGLLFIFFIKRKPKTLFIWALALMFLINAPGLIPSGTEDTLDLTPYGDYEAELLAEGSYADIVHHRLTVNTFEKIDLGFAMDSLEHKIIASILAFFSFTTIVLQALMLFIFGALIAKKRWLHHIGENKMFLKKTMIIFLIAGLGLKGGMVLSENAMLDYYGYLLGGPLAAVGYMAGFSLLFDRLGATAPFRGFAYLGRMALTNYLLQSVIMTTIFYGYGVGMFGKLGPLTGSMMAAALIGGQIFFSRYWLQRHRFGPMEWLWRKGTYL